MESSQMVTCSTLLVDTQCLLHCLGMMEGGPYGLSSDGNVNLIGCKPLSCTKGNPTVDTL
jgi:hypothetical protein